jgi:hypothetical protein
VKPHRRNAETLLDGHPRRIGVRERGTGNGAVRSVTEISTNRGDRRLNVGYDLATTSKDLNVGAVPLVPTTSTSERSEPDRPRGSR